MTKTITAAEFQALVTTPKRKNKYNARKTVVDGVTYDSGDEANYGQILRLRERAGEICELQPQVEYKFRHNGVDIGSYIADFVFYDVEEKRTRVQDVKGVETDVFKLKKKMMKAFHGINVEVVREGDTWRSVGDAALAAIASAKAARK